jgi:hypothetical protein
VKLLTGATVSPDFGVVGGAGYSPLKGLSLNLGYAFLVVNAPRDGVVLHELDVTTPAITLGLDPPNQTGLVQDPKVVRQEVGRQIDHPPQLTGRHITQREVIDDRQAHRLPQGGVHPCSLLQIQHRFTSIDFESSMVVL